MRWGRGGWGALLAMFSAAVLLLDIITGQHISFPIMFVVPVGLATWLLGRRAGLLFAVVLVAGRLSIALNLESPPTPVWAAIINALIRLPVLVGLVLLLDQVARQRRDLAKRVMVLEGILPICAHCKKIRHPDGSWEMIEDYVSGRSQAEFSHTCCEACTRELYPELAAKREAERRDPQ